MVPTIVVIQTHTHTNQQTSSILLNFYLFYVLKFIYQHNPIADHQWNKIEIPQLAAPNRPTSKTHCILSLVWYVEQKKEAQTKPHKD